MTTDHLQLSSRSDSRWSYLETLNSLFLPRWVSFSLRTTDLQRIPSVLPYTLPSPIWKVRTPTLECCLSTTVSLIQSSQTNWHKLFSLGLNPKLCYWISDFLICWPRPVRIGNITAKTLIMNIGIHLSPILHSFFTHDCLASQESIPILKFTDDTTVIGLITNGDESTYPRELENLVLWCQNNNLTLNVSQEKGDCGPEEG